MAEYHPTHEPVRSDDSTPEDLHTECNWCGIDGMDARVEDPCPYKGPRDHPLPMPDPAMQAFVADLRALSDRLATHPEQDRLVYFPPAEAGEAQPVPLVEDVRMDQLAGLLHYVADMLEE